MLQVKLEKPTPDNSCLIPLGNGLSALVDSPLPPGLGYYKWRAVKWNYRWYAYASRRFDGSRCSVAMHRYIAGTPAGEIAHHLNGRSLDNRLANLSNMTNRLHARLHGIRIWRHH